MTQQINEKKLNSLCLQAIQLKQLSMYVMHLNQLADTIYNKSTSLA